MKSYRHLYYKSKLLYALTLFLHTTLDRNLPLIERIEKERRRYSTREIDRDECVNIVEDINQEAGVIQLREKLNKAIELYETAYELSGDLEKDLKMLLDAVTEEGKRLENEDFAAGGKGAQMKNPPKYSELSLAYAFDAHGTFWEEEIRKKSIDTDVAEKLIEFFDLIDTEIFWCAKNWVSIPTLETERITYPAQDKGIKSDLGFYSTGKYATAVFIPTLTAAVYEKPIIVVEGLENKDSSGKNTKVTSEQTIFRTELNSFNNIEMNYPYTDIIDDVLHDGLTLGEKLVNEMELYNEFLVDEFSNYIVAQHF